MLVWNTKIVSHFSADLQLLLPRRGHDSCGAAWKSAKRDSYAVYEQHHMSVTHPQASVDSPEKIWRIRSIYKQHRMNLARRQLIAEFQAVVWHEQKFAFRAQELCKAWKVNWLR